MSTSAETACHTSAPRVSVIMPVHNAVDSLESAVASVLRQTMSELELLIVDDGSTDGSDRLAARLASDDCRIRVFRLPHNRGQSAARNVAIREARGTWIAPVDADDEITAGRLAVLCDAAEREDAALIADEVEFVAPSARHPAQGDFEARSSSGTLHQISLVELIHSDIPLNGRRSFGYLKPLMLRSFLQVHGLRYDEQLRFAEDLNLYARALLCGGRFLLHPQSHYFYNQTPVSASRDIRVLPGVAEQALVNSRRLSELVQRQANPNLESLLHDHQQRWTTVLWFNQVKLALREGKSKRAVRLILQCPSGIAGVLSFALARRRDRQALNRLLNGTGQ